MPDYPCHILTGYLFFSATDHVAVHTTSLWMGEIVLSQSRERRGRRDVMHVEYVFRHAALVIINIILIGKDAINTKVI